MTMRVYRSTQCSISIASIVVLILNVKVGIYCHWEIINEHKGSLEDFWNYLIRVSSQSFSQNPESDLYVINVTVIKIISDNKAHVFIYDSDFLKAHFFTQVFSSTIAWSISNLSIFAASIAYRCCNTCVVANVLSRATTPKSS